MNERWNAGLWCGLLWIVSATMCQADDTPAKGRVTVVPNAAGIYWQAFSAMPTLNDEQRKAFDAAIESPSAPVTDDARKIVDRHGVSLHELHRAFGTDPCDWQLDVGAGPHLLLPHAQKARELTRVALLRARLRFEAGDLDAAMSDVLAVFKMGRDVGVSPILITYLVHVAIEKSAMVTLARHLPKLGKAQLERLSADLRKLPPVPDVFTSIQFEERLFGGWLERQIETEAKNLTDPQAGGALLKAISMKAGFDVHLVPAGDGAEVRQTAELLKSLTVAEVRESMANMRKDYAELGRIAALPLEERAARIKDFESSLAVSLKPKSRKDALRYFSANFLPSIGNVIKREEQAQARWQLFEQAIRVQIEGAGAVQPIRSKAVEYKQTANGFELRYPVGDVVETVSVGS